MSCEVNGGGARQRGGERWQGGKAACVGAGAVDCGTASARCICCTAFAHCIGSLHCLAESLTLHRRTLHWLDASVTAFARCQCSQLGSLRRLVASAPACKSSVHGSPCTPLMQPSCQPWSCSLDQRGSNRMFGKLNDRGHGLLVHGVCILDFDCIKDLLQG